jgi:hypothetical protein
MNQAKSPLLGAQIPGSCFCGGRSSKSRVHKNDQILPHRYPSVSIFSKAVSVQDGICDVGFLKLGENIAFKNETDVQFRPALSGKRILVLRL